MNNILHLDLYKPKDKLYINYILIIYNQLKLMVIKIHYKLLNMTEVLIKTIPRGPKTTIKLMVIKLLNY